MKQYTFHTEFIEGYEEESYAFDTLKQAKTRFQRFNAQIESYFFKEKLKESYLLSEEGMVISHRVHPAC